MNILYGLYQANSGNILWKGQPVQISCPEDAIRFGIGMVHQHFMLVKTMTVLKNIVLGIREDRYPLFKKKEALSRVKALLAQYGFQLDLEKQVYELSVGNQQRIEIVKALYRKAKLLILDEPTAVLTPQETEEFFHILRSLKEHGHSIILISHNLSDIMAISDRVTVLRDGKRVFCGNTSNTTERELSRYMVGREIIFESYKRKALPQKNPTLTLSHITLSESQEKRILDDISFALRQHEVLGVAGVDGNGQTELAEAITGIRRISSGSLKLSGVDMARWSVRERAERGLAYIPADRHKDALIMDAELLYNLHLKDYYKPPYAKSGLLNLPVMSAACAQAAERFGIKAASMMEKVRLLSGGNQQKIILARELSQEAKIIIACQPTRGLDVGATVYVRDRLMEYRDRGCSVLLVSTDLNEILAMSDRIIVLYRGRMMGIVENTPGLSAELLGMMMGGKKQAEAM
jgi:simple sugar transport system ATP-binding protein